MKSALLAAALVLASPALGQFRSARALIPEDASSPLPGLPAKGVCTIQEYGDRFNMDRGLYKAFVDEFEYVRVEWSDERRAYQGIKGATWTRALALGPRRVLLEATDDHSSRETQVWLAEWHGSALHLYSLDVGDDADLARALRSRGVMVREGVFDGARDEVLAALRDVPLGDDRLRRRLRRPTNEEMARIWNWFEIERWVRTQQARLADVRKNLSRMQRLGHLHLAVSVAREAYYPSLATLPPLEIGQFDYSPLTIVDFQWLEAGAERLVEELDSRIEHRMKWLAGKIEVVEHEVVPNEWGSTPGPGPGAWVRFHAVVRRPDGTVLDDTRKAGEPPPRLILGDMPEGLQYGLCSMGYDDTLTIRIPHQLAFGPQLGDVEVELQIVESTPPRPTRPPLETVVTTEVAPVDAELTPTGLLYRDLVVGEGAEVEVGNAVELRASAWSVFHDELDVERTMKGVVGSDAFLPGVNEGVATMRVGGRRVLFVPPHLADQDPARRGMAQCVVVELVAVQP